MTGSVNQFGEVQAVGGVNEKIEGFFDICKARGLTGGQGVLIPASNVKNLMLREEVVAACAGRRFSIHAVKHVDEAVEVLTGIAAGEPGADGVVPPGSINFLVGAQLLEMSVLRQTFARTAKRRGPSQQE